MSDRPPFELATWPVERLKKHPKQNVHYGLRSPEELQALAELIRRAGMDPIDVTPPGVILSGHQRRYIAEQILGWKEVPVRIRHDLAFDGEAAEEQYFIDANGANRRLSKLQQVRNYVRGLELDAQRQKDRKAKGLPAEPGRARDRVAKLYGLKGRTLDDWLPLLQLPRGVQQAVEDGRLTKAQALRVLDASEDVQAKIAADLTARTTTAKVLKQHLGRHKRKPLTQDKLTRRWRDLFRTLRDLYQRRADCFAALLPKQHGGAELLVEFAELVKEHVAPAMKDTEGGKKTKLKLTLRNQASNAKPSRGSESVKPKLVRRPELATA